MKGVVIKKYVQFFGRAVNPVLKKGSSGAERGPVGAEGF
jgi:hypothetical protein